MAIVKGSSPLEAGMQGEQRKEENLSRRPKPGMADRLAGEARDYADNLKPFLPQELVGGSLPYVPGTEEEAVWNAASQACGTEKVHFCYTIEDRRVYYLACPSSMLSSSPDSWCPLAAALPGNSEYWDKETVYLYEQEGVASALRWDPETNRMQVFLGASRTILPRIQSMDANFVTINPNVADIVVWQNRNLKTEKLARATARMLVIIGLMIALIAIGILVTNYFAINMMQRDLSTVKMKTQEAADSLMMKAFNAMQNDTIKHMVRIQELLDLLGKVDGTLVKYEVNNDKVTWEALVPQAFVTRFQNVSPSTDLEPDGRVRITGRK